MGTCSFSQSPEVQAEWFQRLSGSLGESWEVRARELGTGKVPVGIPAGHTGGKLTVGW